MQILRYLLLTWLVILSHWTIPHQCQLLDTATGFIPTVVVDNQNGDSSVDVHLSNLVNLSTDDLNNQSQGRVDLSVLNGLVTVNTNKTRLPNGQTTGPVIVTVFGIPVYVGHATTKPKPAPKPVASKVNIKQPVVASSASGASSSPVVVAAASTGSATTTVTEGRLQSSTKQKSPRVVDRQLQQQQHQPIDSVAITTVNKSEKADLSRIQLVELLTRMAQKINEQDEMINKLKVNSRVVGVQQQQQQPKQAQQQPDARPERSSPVEVSPPTPPVSPIAPESNQPSPAHSNVVTNFDREISAGSIKFEQVADMLRNRRNNFRISNQIERR